MSNFFAKDDIKNYLRFLVSEQNAQSPKIPKIELSNSDTLLNNYTMLINN